ncbi:hypothetical protein [Miltoncostaea oceani]|uniref:hypothetical protein n=1 Tax=Miltoncostaea oceani TaxID=2843216 RepID=UPI001C3C95E9|nr:hypothetical protein [Miltoncostaea oceani]
MTLRHLAYTGAALVLIVLAVLLIMLLTGRSDDGPTLVRGPQTDTTTAPVPTPAPNPAPPTAPKQLAMLEVTAPDGYELSDLPGSDTLQQFELTGSDPGRPQISVSLIRGAGAAQSELLGPLRQARKDRDLTGAAVTVARTEIAGAPGMLYSLDYRLYKRARVIAVRSVSPTLAIVVESSVPRGQLAGTRSLVRTVARQHVTLNRGG